MLVLDLSLCISLILFVSCAQNTEIPSLGSLDVDLQFVELSYQRHDYLLLFLYKISNSEVQSEFETVFTAFNQIKKSLPNMTLKTVNCDKEPELSHYFGVLSKSSIFLKFADNSSIRYPSYSFDRKSLETWLQFIIKEKSYLQEVSSEEQVVSQLRTGYSGCLVYFGQLQYVESLLKKMKGTFENFGFFKASAGFLESGEEGLWFYMLNEEGSLLSESYQGEIGFEKIGHFMLMLTKPNFQEHLVDESGFSSSPSSLAYQLILFYNEITPANHHFEAVAEMYKQQLGFFACSLKLSSCRSLADLYRSRSVPSVVLAAMSQNPSSVLHFNDIISTIRLIRFIENVALEQVRHYRWV